MLQVALVQLERAPEALVALTYGLGDINGLDRVALRGLETEVETMIEEYEESLHDRDTVEEWRAQDARLAGTAIGQLLQARHSIAEEILNLQDDSNDYG
jgi:predicted component of type VI protein secretion system